MSSFIIDKPEIVKFAGLVRGYYGHKDCDHLADAQIIYSDNVKSVNEQYDRDDPEDTETYEELFNEYERIGHSTEKNRTFERCLYTFYRSMLYQIDNDALYEEVHEIVKYAWGINTFSPKEMVDGWWGSVDIDDFQ